MKKNSTYDINGDLYEFNNDKLKEIIRLRNPNRGAFEEFYREVVSLNVGISYDTVKGWVKNDTNPALEDVMTIANVLKIPFTELLSRTHFQANKLRRLQNITFDEVTDPFSLRYDGFSNVLDMIIGMGYNAETKESKVSDFAERIISIIGIDKIDKIGFPELLGYKFIYSDENLRAIPKDELEKALTLGYVDDEGNSLFDKDNNLVIDRKKFGRRLIENTSWLDSEDRKELQQVIEEADDWWDKCNIPYGLLKLNINVCGTQIASFTCGPGWKHPTHEDSWKMLLDVLPLIGTSIETVGLSWIREMHIDQFESEIFLTIELDKFFDYNQKNI